MPFCNCFFVEVEQLPGKHGTLDLNVTMVTSLSWKVTIVSKNILESFEFMSLNRKTLTFI